MRTVLQIGYLTVLAMCVALFLKYVVTGDGWRSFGLFLVILLVIELRGELTKRVP